MRKFLLPLILLILSCEEIIEPENKYGCLDSQACNYDAEATIGNNSCTYAEENHDCEGNCTATIDCLNVCGGDNDGGAAIDCDGNCIWFDIWGSHLPVLGNNDCDTYVYACQEHNCDEGDCGTWNGSECVGSAAIKYSTANNDEEPYPDHADYILDIHSTDPSIPSNFINQYYYNAIVGTYSYSFIIDWSTQEDELVSGYYTTYNPINGEGICFELSMGYIGARFNDWYPQFATQPDCITFFGYDVLDRELSNDKSEKYNEQLQKYNNYLDWKKKENDILNKPENANTKIINKNIVKISNRQNNITIMEIDNDPDVIVQQGKNYIMKYVKREINK